MTKNGVLASHGVRTAEELDAALAGRQRLAEDLAAAREVAAGSQGRLDALKRLVQQLLDVADITTPPGAAAFTAAVA